MRPCPSCGRKIQDAAQKCHFCGAPAPHASRTRRSIEPAPAPTIAEPPSKLRVSTAVVIGVVVALLVGLVIALSL